MGIFYENYVKACNRIKKSPSAVAVANGLSKSAVNGWKTGRTNPTDATITKLAAYFGVSVGYLLGEEEKQKTPTPVGERNVIRLIGRDGSVIEKVLTDEQLSAYKTMVDHLPEADDF